MFHPRCGRCVSLSNGNRTACRTNPHHEFNRGLVFSLEPIKDNEVFEIKIDKKLNTWSGSVEIGVTVCNPDVIDIPFTATDLRGGTWVLLGHGVLRDGRSVMEAYGCDLDQLVEGDRVGVMRRAGGELEFYVNGESQGVAAVDLPPLLYAVVDMYGKCAQITLTHPTHTPDSNTLEVDSPSELSASASVSEHSSAGCISNTNDNDNTNNNPNANNNSTANTNLGVNGCTGTDRHPNSGVSVSVLRQQQHQRNTELLATERSAKQLNEDDGQDVAEGQDRQRVTGACEETVTVDRETVTGREAGTRSEDQLVCEEGTATQGCDVLTSETGSLGRGFVCVLPTTSESEEQPQEYVHPAVPSCTGDADEFEAEMNDETLLGVDVPGPVLTIGADGGNSYDDEEEAADKGNEKDQAASSSSPASFALTRDSNVITANTEQLCRLLNITMETILSGDSAASVAQGRLTVSGQDVLGSAVRLSNRLTSSSNSRGGNALLNNTLNALRQSGGEDPCRCESSSCSCHRRVGEAMLARRSRASGTSYRAGTQPSTEELTQRDGSPPRGQGGASDVDVGYLPAGDTSRRMATDGTEEDPTSFANTAAGGVGEGGRGIAAGTDNNSSRATGGSNYRNSNNNNNNQSDFLAGPSNNRTSTPPLASAPDNQFDYNEVDRLRFHDKCGTLIKLSCGGRTAERRRPLDEFNNGVVMSNRALKVNELFEIRIDRLVDKWSGSIEVGITTHDPALLEFPATMTNMRSGTTMMSGTGILKNGKGILRQYGDFNLDELQEGDRIGMMIRPGGTLHYFINGLEQGVASTGVSAPVWCVVDLYGMTAKVTLVDRDDVRELHNLQTRFAARPCSPHRAPPETSTVAVSVESCASLGPDELLQFSTTCGRSAEVFNGGLTAHRPTANEDFNHGVVLTCRPLRAEELFEVQLDKCVDKWAGSLEIGVTTHAPQTLDYPSTMTNVRTGTWMMTGNGVMHNGTTVIDDYGLNLDRLRVGDRVGVVRRINGDLQFFVNGVDQGVAATQVPDDVYGVVDLYGQAAQATIIPPYSVPAPRHASSRPATPPAAACTNSNVATGRPDCSSSQAQGGEARLRQQEQHSTAAHHGERGTAAGGVMAQIRPPFTANGTSSAIYSDLRFHQLCGRNACIIRGGLGAERPHADAEFNDAIVISNRQLHEGEMFEVMIEKVVTRWSGSLEAGVTAIRPEEIEFPSTMTDIDYDTWMLSGSTVMMNGAPFRNNYACDLDALETGARIGMMRHADGTLHYYVNGIDQGAACGNLPPGVWAVVDLYGQCAQVSIVHNPVCAEHVTTAATLPEAAIDSDNGRFGLEDKKEAKEEVLQRLSYCHGSLVSISSSRTAAHRVSSAGGGGRVPPSSLVFTNSPLALNELFEVRISALDAALYGSIRVGLSSLPLVSGRSLPPSLSLPHCVPPCDVWWIGDTTAYHNSCTSTTADDKAGRHENTWRVHVVKHAVCPPLSRLRVGDRVGVRRGTGGTLHVHLNGRDYGAACTGLEDTCALHGVLELHGSCVAVEVTSYARVAAGGGRGAAGVSQDSLELSSAPQQQPRVSVASSPPAPRATPCRSVHCVFSSLHGTNVTLSSDRLTASRLRGYDQGILLSARPLPKNSLLKVLLSGVSPTLAGGLLLGVVCGSPPRSLPSSALALLATPHTNCFLICGQDVYHGTEKVRSMYGPGLDAVSPGTTLGLCIDAEARLRLLVNGVDCGVAAKNVPANPYMVVDLSGGATEVSLVNGDDESPACGAAEQMLKRKSQHNSNQQQQQQQHRQHEQQQQQQQVVGLCSPALSSHDEANLAISRSMTNADHHTTASNDSNAAGNVFINSIIMNESNNDAHLSVIDTSAVISTDVCEQHKTKGKWANVRRSELILKKCAYQRLCARYLASLALPEAYLSSDVTCYCESCHHARGEEPVYVKGNGVEYHRPMGWVQFGLVGARDSVDTWHMAYCAVCPGLVRRTLDKGELLFPGEVSMSVPRGGGRHKDEDSDGSLLSFSPSVEVADQQHAQHRTSALLERSTGRRYSSRLLLQVAVKPGAYKKVERGDNKSGGGATPRGAVGAKGHTKIQWVTKERGATHLLALLVATTEEEVK